MADALNFEESFSLTSDEAWNAKLSKELRGAPEDKLRTLTREGITLQPYYRAAEHGSPAIPGLAGRENNGWEIRTTIDVDDPDEAVDIAEDSHARKVDYLDFAVDSYTLFALMDLLNLENPEYRHEIRLTDFPTYDIPQLRTSKLDAIRLDLLGSLARRGDYAKNAEADWKQLGKHLEAYPKGLLVDAALWNEAGLPAHWQLGLCLATVHDYLAALVTESRSAAQILENLSIRVSIGPNFFTEIAKLRALRVLLDMVQEPWTGEEKKPLWIDSTVARWNQVRSDADTNLLRSSIASLAAVIGGADSLHVVPHDDAFKTPNRMSRRIADNIQHLLRHEGHLDVAADPAAGSWYLESLTDQLGARSWEVFQTIEAQGGLEQALLKGLISTKVQQEANLLRERVISGEEVLVGLNRYPNEREKTPEARERIQPGAAAEPAFTPIRPFRAAPEWLAEPSKSAPAS